MKSVKRWIERRKESLLLGIRVGSGVLLCVALLGSGCTVPIRWEEGGLVTTSSTSTGNTSPAPEVWTWQDVASGVRRLDARVASANVGARVLLWSFDPAADYEWKVVRSSDAMSVAAMAESLEGEGIAINGGYFHPDGLPSGLVQIDGTLWGARAFDPGRSGFAFLGAQPTLVDGTVTTTRVKADIVQSYPWILYQGKQSFRQETGNYARRTFVGTDKEGRWYVGIVPDTSVTLYQLGLLLQELPIQWRHVLNMDGGPSSGLVARIEGVEDRINSFAPVAYILYGKKRKE